MAARKKSCLGKVTRVARKMKKLRRLETAEARQERLRRDRERVTAQRAAAGPEEREAARRHCARVLRQRRYAQQNTQKRLRTLRKIQEILDESSKQKTCKSSKRKQKTKVDPKEQINGKSSMMKKKAEVDPLAVDDPSEADVPIPCLVEIKETDGEVIV